MDYQQACKILNLSKDYSAEDVNRAFKKMAMLYHPDKNPGNKEAEEKFKNILNAKELLLNKPKNSNKEDLIRVYQEHLRSLKEKLELWALINKIHNYIVFRKFIIISIACIINLVMNLIIKGAWSLLLSLPLLGIAILMCTILVPKKAIKKFGRKDFDRYQKYKSK